MRFSQRKGFVPVKNAIQKDSIDGDIRNSIWNCLTVNYWNLFTHQERLSNFTESDILTRILWLDYFKAPLDQRPSLWWQVLDFLRKYFFSAHWYFIYDFIEFVANNSPNKTVNERFILDCNAILEREVSAYRFVGSLISQITSKEEIEEIEKAVSSTEKLATVNKHLESSLRLLSDRKNPDYRNSIKESISAVERICQLMTNDPKATLGQALGKIDNNRLHPALRKAFEALYGYASNAQGIRHALQDVPNLEFEDAKFFLVSCSAFTNYLIAKASKAGVELKE